MVKYTLFLLTALTMTSCFQTHGEDDLRDVPVTNNPYILPQTGSGGPMMGNG